MKVDDLDESRTSSIVVLASNAHSKSSMQGSKEFSKHLVKVAKESGIGT